MRVVFCRSNRHHEEVLQWAALLARQGFETYTHPQVTSERAWAGLSRVEQVTRMKQLTSNHMREIDAADVIFVFNKGGQAGNSVTLELGYAAAKGKVVYALEPDTELNRDVFYEGYALKPDELVRLLTRGRGDEG